MNPVGRFLDPQLIEQLKHLSLSARSVAEGGASGLYRSPLKGASVEFRQHRFYVPGDEPRRLDWRILARTDRPYVKEYDEETNLRCLICLDASGSMGYAGQSQQGGQAGEDGSKLEYAARLAAALAYLMLSHSESVGLSIVGQRPAAWLAPAAGPAQLSRIIGALERTAAAGPSDIAAGLHAAADRLERRSLVLVLSDFFAPVEELRGGIAHLRHERHEVIAIQITDRDEEEFPLRRWVRLRGLEGEGARLGDAAMLKKTYLENFRRHRETLRADAQRLGAELELMVSDRPLIDAITRLVKRRAGAK